MSGTPLSEDAMRDSLLDIRLPEAGALAPVADILLAAGLGGALALAVLGVARMVSRRREAVCPPSVADRAAALRALPEDARRIGFLHLLKEVAPERYAEIRPELYRRAAEIDPEAEVMAHV